MNKILYALMSLVALASCSTSYNIQGTSNMSTIDGQKLYLKVLKDGELKSIDSCDVVHGQFSFSGTIDSVQMGQIFMDETSLLPVVLEGGDINIKIDNAQQTVSGTPLNDKLFRFLKRYTQLQNQQDELVHKHDQAIMNGLNMEVVNRSLAQQNDEIGQKLDHLVTTFIKENFDNVLGPGVFMMMTSAINPPMFTPWIEDILSQATARFKNDPYVKEFVETAKRNQDILNGMAEPGQGSAEAAPGTVPGTARAPMTPAQMAGDSLQ